MISQFIADRFSRRPPAGVVDSNAFIKYKVRSFLKEDFVQKDILLFRGYIVKHEDRGDGGLGEIRAGTVVDLRLDGILVYTATLTGLNAFGAESVLVDRAFHKFLRSWQFQRVDGWKRRLLLFRGWWERFCGRKDARLSYRFGFEPGTSDGKRFAFFPA